MNAFTVRPTASEASGIRETMDRVCRRVAPLWPLSSFVAVNPYFGLRHLPFWAADATLRRITGVGLTMPRGYYRDHIASGRITLADLAEARDEWGGSEGGLELEEILEPTSIDPRPKAPRLLVTDVLGDLEGEDWSGFVVDRISRFCAAYFDRGQALWPMPWREEAFYRAWRAYARIDKTPRAMGIRGVGAALAALPETAEEAVFEVVGRLAVPQEALDAYLHAALLSVGGWAGWVQYRNWRADPGNGGESTLRDLLAVRLVWDLLLGTLRGGPDLAVRWQKSLITARAVESQGVPVTDGVLQTAFEIGYRRQLIASLAASAAPRPVCARPALQAVFCIDVRSEIVRRHLETIAPEAQTLGFAGFFGIPMAYLPLASVEARDHLPVFFSPSYRIRERPIGGDPRDTEKLTALRRTRLRVASAWKTFKTSAVSCFTFVEAAGLLYVAKIFSDSIGWSRPVPRPETRGLGERVSARLGPALDPDPATDGTSATGIPEEDRPALAEGLLRTLGLTGHFARLVLLVGHGSATTNNPQGTGLDCGACGGQSGEANARVAAALLNDSCTRRGLAQRGIVIPEDTRFVPALHSTTTDAIRLLDTDRLPASHAEDLSRTRRWLEAAAEAARGERASALGLDTRSPRAVTRELRRRSRDWSEVRPEWGLAGNAAFIVAPRARTRGCVLAGRVFLHDYDWRQDRDFRTLELLMTAPMVVASWINLQYFGSAVDPRRFGSGNKVLHNVVGGAIGVLEGNGGDLRTGLAWQSLHDGRRWIHEPVRLHVVIEAPRSAIDAVVARAEEVRTLVKNAWIHLFQIEEDGRAYRRGTDRRWCDVSVG